MTSAPVSKSQHPTAHVRTSPADGDRPLLSPAGWGWLITLGTLFVILHRSVLVRTVRIATGEWSGDWSHALIVPAIGAYFIYQHRHKLLTRTARVCWPGLIVIFAGLFGFAWSIYPARNDMLQGYSMIVSLFGLVLFLLGPKMMRVLWFPIAYLALGVKVAPKLWDHVAWTLQRVAAGSAAVVLEFLGHFLDFEASNRGATIDLSFWQNGELVTEGLNIAEACAGLRMLMAFIALAAAMAFLTDRAWWQRLLMLVLAVPVAIIVNVGRVTVLGLLFLVDKEMAQGSFHTFVGMLMLIPAAWLFMLIGWVLDKLVIEEESGPSAADGPIATLEPSSPGAGPGSLFEPRAILGGLMAGVGLTVLVGLTYACGLGMIRPDLLLGDSATFLGLSMSQTSSMLIAVFALAAGLLVVAMLLVRRWVVRGGDIGAGLSSVRTGAGSLAIAAGVLLAAASGLNGVVLMTRSVLIKEPIPLRKPLYFIDTRLGSWQMIGEDPPLGPEALEALGTRHYISREYRDRGVEAAQPGARAKLHVAYYTGTPDTVPHVADRCYVAGGITPHGVEGGSIRLAGGAYRPDRDGWAVDSLLEPAGVYLPRTDIPATVFTFVRPGTTDKHGNVVYFFVANGRFLATPEGVRLSGFDPRDRYSYYCKVEVLLMDVEEPEEAIARASGFLSAVMPEIMACLPAWPYARHDHETSSVAASSGVWPFDVRTSRDSTSGGLASGIVTSGGLMFSDVASGDFSGIGGLVRPQYNAGVQPMVR